MEIIRRNTCYALRALVNLGRLKEAEKKSVKALAEQSDVPEAFLRKILQKLAAAEIVESSRGPDGGYGLAKPPRAINILEVIEQLQGRFAINRCFLGRDACPRQRHCKIRTEFVGAQKDMARLLEGITLDMLIRQEAGRKAD